MPEHGWRPLPEYELAEVAEVCDQPTGWSRPSRSAVKREVAETKTGALYWKYHATVTNEEGRSAREVVVWRLQQAARGNAMKEQKSGFELEKLPTQTFHANWASLIIGQRAFHLEAWFKRLELPPNSQRATIKTIRHHFFNLTGKLVRTTRRCFLMISDHYCYQTVWCFASGQLTRLKFGSCLPVDSGYYLSCCQWGARDADYPQPSLQAARASAYRWRAVGSFGDGVLSCSQ